MSNAKIIQKIHSNNIKQIDRNTLNTYIISLKYPQKLTKTLNNPAAESEFNNLISNTNIAVIGAHLLAIPTDPTRCAEREAQAQVIQNIVTNYIQKGYEVVVLGDMNDFDGDIPDINNNKPTSQVLSILKGNAGKSKGKYKLYSVGEKVTNQSQRYSDWYDSDNNCNTNSVKDLSTIDHILLTPNLYNRINNVFYYHGYNISCSTYNSDHYPVVVDILTN